MIEIVFDEITRNTLKDAIKLVQSKNTSPISENICCLDCLLDIGKIDLDLYCEERITSLNCLLGDLLFSERLSKLCSETNKIVEYARAKAKFRVWHCNMAYSICALYRLCDLLSDIECDIEIIEFPRGRLDRQSNYGEGWGFIGPNETVLYANKGRTLSKTEKLANAEKWRVLCQENSNLRVLEDEKIISVSEKYYDDLIYKIIEKNNFDTKQAIGELILTAPVYINMAFFKERAEKLKHTTKE
jgi:hypothetical protein